MLKTFAFYGENVNYVSVDVTEEEYNGIKKLMAELHDENDKVFYDIDLRECKEKESKKR